LSENGGKLSLFRAVRKKIRKKKIQLYKFVLDFYGNVWEDF